METLFYTRRDAAKACSVSEETIKRAIHSGRLRAKRSGDNGGGIYLISRDALMAWHEQLEDA